MQATGPAYSVAAFFQGMRDGTEVVALIFAGTNARATGAVRRLPAAATRSTPEVASPTLFISGQASSMLASGGAPEDLDAGNDGVRRGTTIGMR